MASTTPGVTHLKKSRRFPKGGWLVRYRDTDNRTRRRTFEGKKEALDFQASVRTDKRRGDFLDPKLAQTPFKDVADRWYTTRKSQLTPATLAGYRSILNTHLLPTFGHRPVGRIKPSDIEAMLADVKKKGTQRNILRVMSPIMKLAVRDGMIRVNPCSLVELNGKTEHHEMRFLTDKQVAQLAEEVGPEYRTLVYFAAYTGLRAGEIVALRVKHLDLVKRRVHVRESATSVSGTIHIGTPKTKRSRRSVGLPSFLADMLMEHVAGRDQESFVFAGSQGGTMRHGNFYARHFRPAVKRLTGDETIPEKRRGNQFGAWPKDLEGLRFHDLRHTTASLLIDLGTHPKAVSEWLGHSSIAITMDRYGHLYEGADEEILDGLSKRFEEAQRFTWQEGDVQVLRPGQ